MKILQKILLSLLSLLSMLLLMESALTVYRLVKHGTLSRSEMIDYRVQIFEQKFGPIVDEHEEQRWANSLILHPLFGYVRNPEIPTVNNYGFDSPYDFELNEKGYELVGFDKEKTLVVGIFGGSFANIFGQHMRDYLEKELDPLFPDTSVKVVVCAMGGHALPQSANIFLYLNSMIDVAVYVDGLNELMNYELNNSADVPPEYAKAPHWKYRLSLAELDAVRFQRTTRIMELRNSLSSLTSLSLKPFIRQSVVGHYLWGFRERGMDREMRVLQHKIITSYYHSGERFQDSSCDQMLNISTLQFGRYHRLIHKICHNEHISDLHYIQPNPYAPGAKKPWTPEEKALLDPGDHTFRETVVKGYGKLRKELARLNEQGGVGRDLSSAFDGHEGLYWYDYAHANKAGSLVVADELLQDFRAHAREILQRKKQRVKSQYL